ncbi:MAG: tRNA (adenosine(37)-N6)-threonylcarbamoyltransferase complex ATPase subunit type 1 TsaE [Saprospiraceae bacterium]
MSTIEYIKTEKELHAFAMEVLPLIKKYSIICLEGSMGAGKTRFVRALGEHLGIESEVSSPTFSIINEYICSQNSWGIKQLFHMDLYRLKNIQEAIDIGIREYFDSGTLCLIEWPELVAPLLEQEMLLRIRIEVLDNNQRKFTLTL